MANAKPSFKVFFIKEIGKTADNKPKNKWVEVGAAWELESGRINLSLDLVPAGVGTLQLVPQDILDTMQKDQK